MKKITFMVLGMAAMIAVSCGEKKEAPKEGEAATTEAPAEAPAKEEASAATGYDAVLDKYEKIADEHIALMKKVQAGDTAAVADATKVSEELMKIAEELQKTDPTTITKEQTARFQAIAEKYQKALMP
ncbi:hypothetical protein AS361_06720 [Myroides marinus]|uniref:DUF6591 domain-containing protein n=1 Tax=Myroides TaxID=76831 RepID=UPI000741E663|nr:DUF6591 domain-containing protein [Myroides marinus]KUF45324.1 hypothetical protein AS361_06720 [Myroides marinus]MDM1359920.1 hypothetical protein [Myroides marinus]